MHFAFREMEETPEEKNPGVVMQVCDSRRNENDRDVPGDHGNSAIEYKCSILDSPAPCNSVGVGWFQGNVAEAFTVLPTASGPA